MITTEDLIDLLENEGSLDWLLLEGNLDISEVEDEDLAALLEEVTPILEEIHAILEKTRNDMAARNEVEEED